MRSKPRQGPERENQVQVADQLHSAAIHLLRRLRVEDVRSGLSAPRLSALSVIVFGGPIAMSELAAAEQVRAPTISRLVADLERDGLVARTAGVEDKRVWRIEATPRGRRLLREGRARRVARLAAELRRLPAGERRLLARAAGILRRLTLPASHPRKR